MNGRYASWGKTTSSTTSSFPKARQHAVTGISGFACIVIRILAESHEHQRPSSLSGGGGQVPSVFSPPFRPCPGPVPASKGDQRRRILLPEKYHGTSPLNEYQVHFEMCAVMNRWSDADKAKYLAVCLRGQAQSLLGSLQQSQLSDYTSLVDALQERFGLAGLTEIFMAELQSPSRPRKHTRS